MFLHWARSRCVNQFRHFTATSSGMKWHEVACSRCDTPLEVACATWSGMKWHAHGATRHSKACATWSGMKWHAHGATRHLKWHMPLGTRRLYSQHATRSGICLLKWPLEVAWSGKSNPPHLLVLCVLPQFWPMLCYLVMFEDGICP